MKKGFTVGKGGPLRKRSVVKSQVDLNQLTKDEQYKIYLVEIEDYASGGGMTVEDAMEHWPFSKWLSDMGVKVEGQIHIVSQEKFALGRLLTTPGALKAFAEAGDNALHYLLRHVNGDWGDMDEHDKAENEYALTRYLRIFSAYHLSNGVKIWIVTEADRSATTILLPDEY